ncbi:secondary thiamine-phosphate synthase enzyme YjbQ [Trichloromonas acetexigens]|uniref:YjbQ family protein n=1 Tax=Trichloromonas acetexigens TaxID=38815 RepID=A0A550JDD8_9BACT|nr:secondary thiamine-phosphate synthase enzyme YjbQ [Desulfuromonas acetexigens]TRO81215.1 YjbQ family protein [Desulfuromonas acetexigens]
MITLDLRSRRPVEMIDVTAQVRDAVRQSGIRSGLALVFTPHTTAAVTINENADPDVVADLCMEINKIVPFDDHYRHAEGNSAAHLKSSLFGASETLIVEDGAPVLGTWQGIYFCEFDGPRSRRLHIQVIGA